MDATFSPMFFPLKNINTPPPGARGKFSFRLDQLLTFGKKTAPVVCGVSVLLFGRPQNWLIHAFFTGIRHIFRVSCWGGGHFGRFEAMCCLLGLVQVSACWVVDHFSCVGWSLTHCYELRLNERLGVVAITFVRLFLALSTS